LWPDLPLDRAVRAFGVTLHGLRRALEPELPRGATGSVIELRGDAYRLALAPGDGFDVSDFLRLAREPHPDESPAERLRRLRAAEGAYAGPLYPEWPYAEWAAERRAEVEAAYRSVEEQLALATEDVAPGEAVERYRRLVEREPEREQWHRGLMRAHAAAGDLALALRQYHACRAVLVRELGVEPGPETRALYRRLLVSDAPPIAEQERPAVTVS
jgi:DNA-binding SARP family transcriptional activator